MEPAPPALPDDPLPISPPPLAEGVDVDGKRLELPAGGGAAKRDPAELDGTDGDDAELDGGEVDGRVPTCALVERSSPSEPTTAAIQATSRNVTGELILNVLPRTV